MSSLDQTTINEKLISCEKSFDKIQSEIKKIELQEQKLSQEKAELNVELFRLQGEHRLLKSLLETKPETAVESPNEVKS